MKINMKMLLPFYFILFGQCILSILSIQSMAINLTTTTTTIKKTMPPFTLLYWTMDTYPNPMDNPYGCRQPKKSLLCDPDQILDQIQANQLRDSLDQLQHLNKCFCKKCPPGSAYIKVAVALAKTIQTNSFGDEAYQKFADHLHNQWQFSLCNDSILLLVVQHSQHQQRQDHRSSIVTSLGHIAERIFPHQFFANFINDSINISSFQLLNKLIIAINQHVQQIDDPSIYTIQDAIKASSAVQSNDHDNNNSSKTALIVVAIITGFIFFLAFVLGTVLYMKQHYQQQPDSELPEIDGYESVSTTENEQHEHNNNNNDNTVTQTNE